MTIEDLQKIEKKFNFLEKYLNKDIEIISDEWGLYKEDIEYKIWLSDSSFIYIKLSDKKIKIITEKKDFLMAWIFIDSIKTINEYDEKEIKNYKIKINGIKNIEYKSEESKKSIENILEYIKNEANKIEIETEYDKKNENNCIIWIESKDYEPDYLRWKSYHGKSTSQTKEEKEMEYNKLTEKEKEIIKIKNDITINESLLVGESTRNFFGEEYLKNKIKISKEKIEKINKSV